jgi:glycosyltransferase involved in cell wall biosynthesis
MRVLAISSYGGVGGSELGLAAFLRHRPGDVDAHALLVSDGPLRERLLDVGVPVWIGRGYEGRPDLRAVVRFTRALAPLLRRLEPEVVWARGQKAAVLAVPACRAARVPLVWNKVDFSWDALLAVPLALASNGVVGVSDAVTIPLGPLRRRRVVGVVASPVTLSEGLRSRPDPARPVIGSLGRLVPYKGHHRVLEAARLLAAEFPDLRVVIAGGTVAEYPDYPVRLRRLAAELGIAASTRLPGFVDDVESLLAGLTVYVNATHRDAAGFGFEGLGGAMLQASWAGVPVVAPRSGGTGEAVIDGLTGTLVDDATPPLLAEAIAAYLRDPALAAATGAAGRRHARAHAAPAVTAPRLFAALARTARPPRRSY